MAQLAADYEVGAATIFRALQGPFERVAPYSRSRQRVQ
jgi:hypothetical protein